MAERTLKEKTAKGLMWSGISNGMQQLLNLVFGIFLGRLLSAYDYGMVGMLTIFSAMAAALQESGFISALANRRNIQDKDYNAVFWFNILCSAILYVLLFFCAPLIADFYHTPELVPLSRVAFLSFFISSFGIAPRAVLFRNLMTKQTAKISITALILSGITGITLAANGFSYWSIAVQSLIFCLTVSVLNWHYCPWHPSFKIDFTPIREMIGYSSKLLFTSFFMIINNNLFSVFLGRFHTSNEVGFYNQANKWNTMGYSTISGMINGVAQPVLNQAEGGENYKHTVFRKMLRFTAFISFPAMFGLSLVAPQFITIAITVKWLESAVLMQILCIGGAFSPITNLYSNLMLSQGKSNIYMCNSICIGLLQIALLWCLYPYGVKTMVAAYVALNILWLLVWQYLAWKEIRLTLWQALKDILPFFLASVFTMSVTYFATSQIENIYVLFLVRILLAAVIYIGILWIGKSVILKESIQYLLKRKIG